MKQHKGGIIGFGGIANYQIDVMKIEQYDRVIMKGVYDIDSQRYALAEQKGLQIYHSLEEILSDDELDIIYIATTNDAHMELSIKAMEAGKNVVCEKPVTLSSQELEKIIEVSKKTGKVFTIDQNRRTNRDFVLMKNCVEAGMVGKPYVIESRVEGSRGMPAGWRSVKALGGGMMYDWGVHMIDQILYMYKEKVVSVYCKMMSVKYPEIDDHFRLTLTFESGLVVHIEVSTNVFIMHPRWYVLGEDGTLQIDSWDCKGRVVKCKNTEDQWTEQIVYTKAGPTKTMAPRGVDTTEVIELSEPLEVYDSPMVVFNQLADAIEGIAELTIKPEEALRVLKVMEAAFESAEKSCVVNTCL